MIKANYTDKSLVIDIVSESFDKNKSVNYVAKQDQNRFKRIRNLMDYSFEVCYLFGEIYLSDDKTGCLLMLYPEKKKTTLKTIFLDFKLAISCVGLSGVSKVLTRESKIKKHHPKSPIYYLWSIGVKPEVQRKGIGSKLLQQAIQESKRQHRDIYLETSTLTNLPWYQKFGFNILVELDLTYKLYILKRESF
jgi:ribosomal protein S18 acetylase RimI-like enzyme